MEDLHLSTIVSVLLVLILMVIVPIYNLFDRQDALIQNFVEFQTEQLTSTIRSSGKITKPIYEEYVHHLDSTGYLFEITFEHDKKVVLPKYSEDGKTFLNSYTSYYESVTTEEIIEALYSSGEYSFDFGDYIVVKAVSRNTTNSSNMFNLFIGKGGGIVDHISYTDGGLIWNETY